MSASLATDDGLFLLASKKLGREDRSQSDHGEPWTHDLRADAHHVDIVVLDTLVGQ